MGRPNVGKSTVVNRLVGEQKSILIGRGGRMLKDIGTAARREIEQLVGSRVFLDLRVKVQARRQQDESAVRRFGY